MNHGLSISVTTPKGARDVELTNSFNVAMTRAAEQTAELMHRTVVDVLAERGHKAEGDLEDTLYTTTDIERFQEGTFVTLHTPDIAASVLEYGAKAAGNLPSTDAVDNILNWLKAKRIRPRYGTERDFAFAIARKIARQGQNPSTRVNSPGRPFSAAQRRVKRRVERIWEDAIAFAVSGGNTR